MKIRCFNHMAVAVLSVASTLASAFPVSFTKMEKKISDEKTVTALITGDVHNSVLEKNSFNRVQTARRTFQNSIFDAIRNNEHMAIVWEMSDLWDKQAYRRNAYSLDLASVYGTIRSILCFGYSNILLLKADDVRHNQNDMSRLSVLLSDPVKNRADLADLLIKSESRRNIKAHLLSMSSEMFEGIENLKDPEAKKAMGPIAMTVNKKIAAFNRYLDGFSEVEPFNFSFNAPTLTSTQFENLVAHSKFLLHLPANLEAAFNVVNSDKNKVYVYFGEAHVKGTPDNMGIIDILKLSGYKVVKEQTMSTISASEVFQ